MYVTIIPRFLWLVPLVAIVGCGTPMMTTEDVVVTPGRPSQLTVCIDRQYLKPSVVGAEVTFYVNSRCVGRAITGENGRAAVSAVIEPEASAYQARAKIDGHMVTGGGRIFHWDLRRTAVAVDIDDTISHTDYSDLFVGQFDGTSAPFQQAPDVLCRMARHFQIVYISARPRWLHEKTKLWLCDHDFPRGPILLAPGFGACFRQDYYKTKLLRGFQERFPNLLIGIGDKADDDRCYGDRPMLAVILGQSEVGYRPHCVVVPDWHAVGEFFEKRRDLLDDTDRLTHLIDQNGLNLRPLMHVTDETAIDDEPGLGS